MVTPPHRQKARRLGKSERSVTDYATVRPFYFEFDRFTVYDKPFSHGIAFGTANHNHIGQLESVLKNDLGGEKKYCPNTQRGRKPSSTHTEELKVTPAYGVWFRVETFVGPEFFSSPLHLISAYSPKRSLGKKLLPLYEDFLTDHDYMRVVLPLNVEQPFRQTLIDDLRKQHTANATVQIYSLDEARSTLIEKLRERDVLPAR